MSNVVNSISRRERLLAVIAKLSTTERAHFWQIAALCAKSVRVPKPRRGEKVGSTYYEGLSLAIQELERGPRKRNGLPTTIKRSSSEELSKAVGALKERLLAQESALPFLGMAFGSFILTTRKAALLSVLDALGCTHDGNGYRIGDVPDVDPVVAAREILELTEKHSTSGLLLCCLGLCIDEPQWASALSLAIDRLETECTKQTERVDTGRPVEILEDVQPMSQIVQQQQAAAPPPGENGMQGGVGQEEVALSESSSPEEVRAHIQELSRRLRFALDELTSDRFPDPSSAAPYWTSLDASLRELCQALQVPRGDIAKLEDSLKSVRGNDDDRRMLERCLRLKHVSDGKFVGLSSIKPVVEALLKDQAPRKVEEMEGLRALLCLVDDAGSISDDEATELGDRVRLVFGPTVATAAIRGKLAVEADLPSKDTIEPTRPQASSESGDAGLVLAGDGISGATLDNRVSADEPQSAVTDSGISAPAAPSTSGAQDSPSDSPEVTQANERPAAGGSIQAPELNGAGASTGTAHDAESQPGNDFGGDAPLQDYELFRQVSWVADDGHVAAAPWSLAGFKEALIEEGTESWFSERLAVSVLVSHALSKLGQPPLVDLSEVDRIETFLAEPRNLAALVSENRASLLRSVIAGSARVSLSLGASTLLEAVAPSSGEPLSDSETSALLALSKCEDVSLSAVIAFMRSSWASKIDPIAVLRDRLDQQRSSDPKEIERELEKAQRELKGRVASLWSAAGGKIQRTHCRKAWTQFMESAVAPLRNELVPQGGGLPSHIWSKETAQTKVIQLARAYQQLMDSAGVKHEDRKAADSAAQQIVAAIDVALDAAQRLLASRSKKWASLSGVPIDQVTRLLSEPSTDPTRRIAVCVLRAALLQTPQQSPLRLPIGVLVDRPQICALLSTDALTDQSAFSGLDYRYVVEPLDVASHLIGWRPDTRHEFADINAVLAEVRERLGERDRWEVLVALSATPALHSHERTLLHRRALSLMDEVFELSKQLETLWGACDELLAPRAMEVRRCAETASALARKASEGMLVRDALFVKEWLKRSILVATEIKHCAIRDRIKLAFERSSDVGQKVKTLFDSGNFRSGVALLHSGEVPSVGEGVSIRRTLWRADAEARIESAATELGARQKIAVTPDHEKLAAWWSQGWSRDLGHRDSLRRALYLVVSGEAGRSQAENQRRFAGRLSELREHKDRKTVISCGRIREYLQKTGANPTFVPQLVDFSQIVITSNPATDANGQPSLDTCARLLNAEQTDTLLVFLEPGISVGRRDDLVSGFRRRGLRCAVIDDIDVCRLLAAAEGAQAQDFIPFLEILLEQLDLEIVSPFSTLDGQHVRIETFIGRTISAQQIALGSAYTRVFSGRKLGKSAFLRFIANTYDQRVTQSGNRLNVIFITIAGGESETWIVNRIIEEMNRKFNLQEFDNSPRLAPGERFSRYIDRFIKSRDTDNVLLILDEADSFVAGQLKSYDRNRENSLSFRMMKQLDQADRSGMPRVRVVLSGYRVTNTRGGVWANAGDVLVLKPLAEQEATDFLTGMLSRIGIDIGDHAPFIARRCGFQPAVLIRFGETLVKRLKRAARSASRETVRVSNEEVLAALGDQSVLDEIKTVVNNNFQGDRVGAAIFGATLLALKDLEPGLALTDGPAQVLRKLHEIQPEAAWLDRFGVAPLAHIERKLQEFIDRELLTVSDAPRFGIREYRLKFPHFLPALAQQSELMAEVKKHIEIIQSGTAAEHVIESVLPDTSLDALRYWFQEKGVEHCTLAVIGGHWLKGLLDDKCGIADRLGVYRHAVARVSLSESVDAAVSKDSRVFAEIHGQQLGRFLEAKHARPLILIGGIDLLREAKRYVLQGGDKLIDVVGQGRIQREVVTWWFEGVRALHFSSAGAANQIYEATNGIPVLVDLMDRQLDHSPGVEVGDSDLRGALQRFDSQVDALAEALLEGPPAVRLSIREAELLRMVLHVVGSVGDDFDISSDLSSVWDMCLQDAPVGLRSALPPMQDESDLVCLHVLVECGLLPTSTGRSSSVSRASLGKAKLSEYPGLRKLLLALEARSAN